MSPNTTVSRPVWVWSLPAVAVFISFLWFRKKRGLIKTDTGGPGEPVIDTDKCHINNIDLQQQKQSPVIVNCEVSQIDKSADNNTTNIFVESVKVEEFEKEEEVNSVLLSTPKVDKLCSVVESSPVVIKAEVEEVLVEEEEVVVKREVGLVESVKTATQSELNGTGEGEVGKWAKKSKRGKKIKMVVTDEERSVGLEQQFAKLELSGENGDENAVEVAVSRERDSANTSPSEVMLASPSLSAYSDTHSEGSSDSGKGCSEVLTPSPTPVSGNSLSGDLPGDLPSSCKYDFVIPQHLVGRLIGRNGSYIQEIKEHTHASVYIKRHPDTPKLKICSIEGTQLDIDNALDMIRIKFPKKRYPNMTLEQIELAPETALVLPDNMQLYLVEGINNDVILSSLVSAAHFFLQQPTHPTYPALNKLNSYMAQCYAEPNLPALPDDIQPGVLCCAPVHNGWYRAEVTCFPEGDTCEVKFVDYGGYMVIEKANLRQIRGDFATLPFQAAECFLAGVQPTGDDWCDEARELVETLTFGRVLQAQVHGYTENGIPVIYLYTVHDNEVVSINAELVSHGFAEWLLPEPVTEETSAVYVVQQTVAQSVVV